MEFFIFQFKMFKKSYIPQAWIAFVIRRKLLKILSLQYIQCCREKNKFRFLKNISLGKIDPGKMTSIFIFPINVQRKNMGFIVRSCGFVSRICLLLCGHFTSVNLNFLICKMGILMLLTPPGCCGD